jgi:hypothetical protein
VARIRSASPSPATQFSGTDMPSASNLTPSTLDAIFGSKGQTNNGMYKAVIGRTAYMHGRQLGNQMGVNTWAAFAGSDDLAFVDGDFAMQTSELQTVLKSLRSSGINIVAIHNHMTHEDPQYMFLHYWGKGKAATLAKAIKSAINKQNASSTDHMPHPEH